MTATDKTADYAASVVEVLRKHFPASPTRMTPRSPTTPINQQMRDPQDSFEFIVDDPFSAKWRLKAKPGGTATDVRLRCYRYNRRQSDNDLEDAVTTPCGHWTGWRQGNDRVPPLPGCSVSEYLTEREIDALVRGHSDEKLTDLHRSASAHPGTEWHLRLSAEMRRRGLEVIPDGS